MLLPKYFTDFHCHPGMKPYYSSNEDSEKKNIWEFISEQKACGELLEAERGLLENNMIKALDSMAKNSQMNLEQCSNGRVRLLFVSLYPVERGWFKIRDWADWFTDNDFITKTAICSSGFHPEVVKEIEHTIEKSLPINYFKDLLGEYRYLLSEKAKSDNEKQEFVIVNNHQELLAVLNHTEKKQIAIVLTMEGGHALSKFQNYHELSSTPFRKVNKERKPLYKHFKKIYHEHIRIIKGVIPADKNEDGSDFYFQHTPFYITFAHHFWNLLCGHADSFQWAADLILKQGRGRNRGFTALGKTVLKMFLHRSERERRMLIDIKHLSTHSRKDFYEIWEEYRQQGDAFPIICSHTAVNGRSNYYTHFAKPEEEDYAYSSFFNISDINLFDADIQMIYRSKGLIGLMLSSSRLPGKKTKDNVKHALKEINRHPDLSEILHKKIKEEYIKSLAANIFHIVQLCGSRQAWDIISIGSDFDGMITPLKNYETAQEFVSLADDLNKFLQNSPGIEEINLSATQMQSLMYGYHASEITDKIMRSNAIDFSRRYFHDDYLKFGIIPPEPSV